MPEKWPQAGQKLVGKKQRPSNEGNLVVGVCCRLPGQGEPLNEAFLLQLQRRCTLRLSSCWRTSATPNLLEKCHRELSATQETPGCDTGADGRQCR